MAVHFISLSTEAVSNENVGNSMSTFYSWNPASNDLTIYWNDREMRSFRAPEGALKVMISCNGGFPVVTFMEPPSNPLKRVAWEFNFFGRKRLESLKKAEAVEFNSSYYDVAHGRDIYSAIVVRGEGYFFLYSVANDGAMFVPSHWWADESADVEAIREDLENLFAPQRRVVA